MEIPIVVYELISRIRNKSDSMIHQQSSREQPGNPGGDSMKTRGTVLKLMERFIKEEVHKGGSMS